MGTFGQKSVLIFLSLFYWSALEAVVLVPNLPQKGVLSEDVQGKMNQKLDYEQFSGRVTDKDDVGRIFKIQVENNNTKFFRAGDEVLFKVNLSENLDYCRAFVRNVEDFYFTIYVETLGPCYKEKAYFRRGTILNFTSKTLAIRTFEATKYREQLIVRKEDFLRQLNEINHFVWSFDQQKVKTAARYDEEINQLEREKRRALDELITEKNEKLVLQNELMKKLNELDEVLKFYRVERQELLTDRWNMDHDGGLPFGQRPQALNKD
jgi:hypothetical protein